MRAALLALAACAPATWPVPAGWRAEVIPFPLDFAPALAHRGVEVIRFAPGFFDPAKPGYWSYAFAWRLDDDVDPTQLGAELTTYFRGLVAAVDVKHRIGSLEPIVVHADGLALTAHVLDAFGDGRPVDLVGTARRQACATGTLWTFTFAPATGMNQQVVDVAAAATCDSVRR